MKLMAGMIVVLGVAGVVIAILVVRAGADEKGDASKAAAAATSPASVTRAVAESGLNVVTLTPDAEQRLDLTTAPVERKKVERSRLFGGEVVLPPGRAVVVSAPVAGTVKPAGDAASLSAGARVTKGQPVFKLVPMLTTEARTTTATALVDAEGQVSGAEVQLKAAEVALARAKQLVADQAGTRRALDDAQAAYDVAQKTLEAARARRDALAKIAEGAQAGSAEPIAIASPEDGLLRNVQVAAAQMVSAGTPLFEVVNPSVLWVRVSVYVGDAADVASDRPAVIGRLGAAGAAAHGAPAPAGSPLAVVTAQPVSAPPSANPLTSTVDVHYQVDDPQGTLSPGQRVGVTLPLRGEADNLTVPWSAVTFDVHGGAWVYERVAEHTYARRRVEVANVQGQLAVLASGPPAGTVIVTQGVAELFGREMGFAK
jgi:RND family efflux transporter MFP subunit